ncbi:MAG: hypothetical protein GY846_10430 [Deltaproteobacteria bacterium]|nr:hypothetical protein [Deltaproteobacteria bacterium]
MFKLLIIPHVLIACQVSIHMRGTIAWLEKGEVDIGLGFKIKEREAYADYLGDHPIH